MLWPLLITTGGLIGLNYKTSQNLSTASSIAEASAINRRVWLMFILGSLTGVWLGVTFAIPISKTLSFIQWFTSNPNINEQSDESTDEKENYQRRKRNSNFFYSLRYALSVA